MASMINEKKKIMSKNAKTILFATLVVAMILPFGMVDASSTSNEKILEKFAKDKAKFQKEL